MHPKIAVLGMLGLKTHPCRPTSPRCLSHQTRKFVSEPVLLVAFPKKGIKLWIGMYFTHLPRGPLSADLATDLHQIWRRGMVADLITCAKFFDERG